jgi:hypothetical protein
MLLLVSFIRSGCVNHRPVLFVPKPFRGLTELIDGSQSGKCGGVAGLTWLEPV